MHFPKGLFPQDIKFQDFPKKHRDIIFKWATKKPPTFHCTGWLIGILLMAYYNPYITG